MLEENKKNLKLRVKKITSSESLTNSTSTDFEVGLHGIIVSEY